MYTYTWDAATGGYLLTRLASNYVANEIRPVFAEELELTGLDAFFEFDHSERRPLMWAQKSAYLRNGEKVAQLSGTKYGQPLSIETFFEGRMRLEPVDVDAMVRKNATAMEFIAADAQRRAKELYDNDMRRFDVAYIAFSGGKDSVALLDICDKVLPLSVPVVFSDTDMELPDTYAVWDEVQKRYPRREFIRAVAATPALDNWRIFAPPSRTIRWCCSVHKSTPALILLKERLHRTALKVIAFVGVRGDESIGRSGYDDSSEGVKNASQLNCMPILQWGAHELWLYIFANGLTINRAYRMGLPRVGCVMCPESSDKYAWYVDKVYPGLVKPYVDAIISTSAKAFYSEAEKTEFIGSSNWQARKSGVVLAETLSNPAETVDGLTIAFQSPHFNREPFFEWIKTIGAVLTDRETGRLRLKLPHTLDEGIPFSYAEAFGGGGTAVFGFGSRQEQIALVPVLRQFFKKVSACVACRACEAECAVGAITAVGGKIRIDGDRCVHCHKCYDIDLGCWRFKSMYKATVDQNKMSGINRYNNFGFREKGKDLWISAAIDMNESFFPWSSNHPLGKKMVDSASAWFQQSLLYEPKTRKPGALLDLFRKLGGGNALGWEFIWMALANNAVLVKWFITATDIDRPYTTDELAGMMSTQYATLGKSTIDGGLAALKDMLTKSPLGGDGTVTLPEMKGRVMTGVTRKAKDVSPLTVLYGLYLVAAIAQRGSFTVREMLTADESSAYVSPIVAFGIPADTFKKQCEGLRSRYPDFIDTTFTHGNDEFQVFPNTHSLDDIIALALEE